MTINCPVKVIGFNFFFLIKFKRKIMNEEETNFDLNEFEVFQIKK